MNLLPNPGAEIDSVAQWQAYTGPGSGAVNSITKAYEGARSFLVTVDESDVVSVIGWYTASPPRSGLGSPETFTAGFWVTENSGGGEVRAYLKVWANGFSVQRTAPAQGITLTSGWQFVTSSITTEPGDVVDRADITFDVIDAMPTVSFHVDHGYIRDATTTQAERVARIRLGQFQLRPIGA
jgi:hypothetical protein